MTKDEALLLALEALEQQKPPADHPKEWNLEFWTAIAAIREALAVQEPVEDYDCVTRQSAMAAIGHLFSYNGHGSDGDAKELLVTASPKRQWVGLTDAEAAECWSTSAVSSWKAIEAKLKEMNT